MHRNLVRILPVMLARHGTLAMMALLFLAASACNSRSPAVKTEDKTRAGVPGQNLANPGIDLNCVADRLQNPPEAFHYSYNWDGNRFVHQEVDVTPQSIDGTIKSNNSGSELTDAIHATRSDAAGWRSAVMSLNFGIAGLAPGFALVNHGSATVRQGAESVNGYDTTRYSIDTARGDVADKTLYSNTLGPGGFEKGSVWVTSQGCPVKISLDDEIHVSGGITKDHYEEAIIRK